MGLFDKKYCDICGNQIKFLGNRKVEDGNICKDCASKLSPFFSDRKRSTVAQIKEQLAYRERNKTALQSFKPDKIIGKRYKVYVDTTAGKFVISSANDYRRENADVIDISSISLFQATVEEDKDELYCKDQDGNSVSYVPPRYEYEYKFSIKLMVNNPYFDEIDFELTDERPDSCTSPDFMQYEQMVNDLSLALTGRNYQLDKSSFESPEAYMSRNMSYSNNVNNMNQNFGGYNRNIQQNNTWTCPNCGNMNTSQFCTKCGSSKPAQGSTMFCPNCGTRVDSTVRFCPNCGKQLF